MCLLELNNVSKNFGGMQALQGVSINIKKNEFVSIIGPNGAGKTTLINLISGYYRPSEGDVKIKGQTTNKFSSDRIASLGVNRTFQVARLMEDKTVLDNLMLGFHNKFKMNIFSNMLFSRNARNEEKYFEKLADRLMSTFQLEPYKYDLAGVCRMEGNDFWKLQERWRTILSCYFWTNPPQV